MDGNVNENVTLQNNRLSYKIRSLLVGIYHLAHRSPENKRNAGICWAKSFTGFKLDATYANIMQHSPTWCTNERNMLCPTCWHNMLRSFARALSPLYSETVKARANERNMLATTFWAQHVSAFICTPCCARLHDVGICCVQFETSQTFCPTYANISFVRVIDEAYHNMLCSFHDSHNIVGLGRAHCE